MAFEKGLGFANELLWPGGGHSGGVIYEVYFKAARAAVWIRGIAKNRFAVNLYQLERDATTQMPTDRRLRVCPSQEPINVEDEIGAQLAIYYLMQTHLPSEVIE